MTRVPVFAWHALGQGPAPLWTSLRRFEEQLDALARAGRRAVPLGTLVDRLRRGEPLPGRAFAITFDDGYRGVPDAALPRLAERGWTATMFLVTGRMGGTSRWPGQPARVPEAPLLGWDRAAALAAAGWELGVHGASHAPLTALSDARVEEEIETARAAIAERTGVRARLLAYPYGAVDERVRAIAARRLDGAAGMRPGLIGPGSDPWDLERIDACYLTPALAASLDRPLGRARLALRRALRRARRTFAQDWERGFSPST